MTEWSKWMEVRRHQVKTMEWVWYDSPSKLCDELFDHQTGIGSDVIMLKEEGPLVWSDSGNLGLQLSQSCLVMM
jgi:hypothetical protein